MNARVHVAVGIIYSLDKEKVLISQRTAGQHLAGFWEFPGGKVEKNEEVYSALKRELDEELGVQVEDASRLTSFSYDYPDKKVLLDVWQVHKWNGEPHSKEGQKVDWVKINELDNYAFPEANKHITQTLFLSSTYLISQASCNEYSKLLSVVEECFSSGLKLFQLRLSSRDEPEFSILIEELYKLSKSYNSKLILNGFPADVEHYKVHGLHLKSNQLSKYESRPISEKYILGASCHNQEELFLAKKLNVNYAFLSPVAKTSSHPKVEAIGWDKFYKMRKLVDFPVYALGGMQLADLKVAKSYNAYGIALISAIWNSNSSVKNIFS